MRTPEEIEAEIQALKALRPVGRWASKTRNTITIVVDYLRGEIDTTADEFEQLSDRYQAAVVGAEAWKNGETEIRPSEGWGDLCRQ